MVKSITLIMRVMTKSCIILLLSTEYLHTWWFCLEKPRRVQTSWSAQDCFEWFPPLQEIDRMMYRGVWLVFPRWWGHPSLYRVPNFQGGQSYEFIILIKVGIMLPRIRGRSWRPRKWAGMTPCRVIEEWWGMINDHDPVSCILSMNSSSGDSIRCLEHTTHRVVHTPYSIHTQFTHPWTLLALHPRASFWASDHRCTLHAFHTLETPRGAQ